MATMLHSPAFMMFMTFFGVFKTIPVHGAANNSQPFNSLQYDQDIQYGRYIQYGSHTQSIKQCSIKQC